MRVLFVSGTSVGGAARSTYELGQLLADRGHTVATLMRRDEAIRTARRHERLVDARATLDARGFPRFLVGNVDRWSRQIGRRRELVGGHQFSAWRASIPENALAAALHDVGPDVVVVNSIDRPAWRQIRADLVAARIPSVLYLREATGVRHLTDPPAPPDLLLANAEAHADAARSLGFECLVVRSAVDTARVAVESKRTHAVLVNPTTLYGLDRALEIAENCQEIPFAFFESWPLTTAERRQLDSGLARCPNLEFHAFDPDPRRVYERARVLMMLCTVPSYPRVVLEAQSNGIPVLATNRPGHDEAVGEGGVLVAPDAPLAEWCEALRNLWEPNRNEVFAQRARAHSQSVASDPEAVVTRFESALGELLAPQP